MFTPAVLNKLGIDKEQGQYFWYCLLSQILPRVIPNVRDRADINIRLEIIAKQNEFTLDDLEWLQHVLRDVKSYCPQCLKDLAYNQTLIVKWLTEPLVNTEEHAYANITMKLFNLSPNSFNELRANIIKGLNNIIGDVDRLFSDPRFPEAKDLKALLMPILSQPEQVGFSVRSNVDSKTLLKVYLDCWIYIQQNADKFDREYWWISSFLDTFTTFNKEIHRQLKERLFEECVLTDTPADTRICNMPELHLLTQPNSFFSGLRENIPSYWREKDLINLQREQEILDLRRFRVQLMIYQPKFNIGFLNNVAKRRKQAKRQLLQAIDTRLLALSTTNKYPGPRVDITQGIECGEHRLQSMCLGFQNNKDIHFGLSNEQYVEYVANLPEETILCDILRAKPSQIDFNFFHNIMMLLVRTKPGFFLNKEYLSACMIAYGWHWQLAADDKEKQDKILAKHQEFFFAERDNKIFVNAAVFNMLQTYLQDLVHELGKVTLACLKATFTKTVCERLLGLTESNLKFYAGTQTKAGVSCSIESLQATINEISTNHHQAPLVSPG